MIVTLPKSFIVLDVVRIDINRTQFRIVHSSFIFKHWSLNSILISGIYQRFIMKLLIVLSVMAAISLAHCMPLGMDQDQAEIEGFRRFLRRAWKVGKCALRNTLNRDGGDTDIAQAERFRFRDILRSVRNCLPDTDSEGGSDTDAAAIKKIAEEQQIRWRRPLTAPFADEQDLNALIESLGLEENEETAKEQFWGPIVSGLVSAGAGRLFRG